LVRLLINSETLNQTSFLRKLPLSAMLIPMTRKIAGYTLIEIMITLIVAISLMSLGVFTLTSYIPKQRLLDATETTEQSLSRAQLEATARSIWACVDFIPEAGETPPSMVVRMDSDGDRVCETTDLFIINQQLRPNISFAGGCSGAGASGTENSFDFTSGAIWFDTAGVPRNCVGAACTPTSFQLVVRSSELPSGNRAREVEALSSGLIGIVNRNEEGYLIGIFAKSAELSTGCE
jgi:hypothetical protein